MADPSAKTSKDSSSRGIFGYFRHRHDPLTSLALTVPVFLLYHLGILFVDLRNGVDLVSGLTFQLLHYSMLAYVGTTLAVAKKLGRDFLGCELSQDYVKYATDRLKSTEVGASLDGPADPVASAPSTANGTTLESRTKKKTARPSERLF